MTPTVLQSLSSGYTLNGATSGIITKNANSTFWIPSEDEWYKAAYYDPSRWCRRVISVALFHPNGSDAIAAGRFD